MTPRGTGSEWRGLCCTWEGPRWRCNGAWGNDPTWPGDCHRPRTTISRINRPRNPRSIFAAILADGTPRSAGRNRASRALAPGSLSSIVYGRPSCANSTPCPSNKESSKNTPPFRPTPLASLSGYRRRTTSISVMEIEIKKRFVLSFLISKCRKHWKFRNYCYILLLGSLRKKLKLKKLFRWILLMNKYGYFYGKNWTSLCIFSFRKNSFSRIWYCNYAFVEE